MNQNRGLTETKYNVKNSSLDYQAVHDNNKIQPRWPTTLNDT